MKLLTVSAVLFLAASLQLISLQPANAGLGAYSSPQRMRCENQASAKVSMWRWFARNDLVQRCMGATGGSGRNKKGRRISER